MAGRYAGWRRLTGNTAERPDLLDYGKKLLGYLQNQQRLSGVQTLEMTRELPDGSSVRARIVGGLPQVDVRAGAGGGFEDVLHLYVSSPGGLRVFDVGAKRLLGTVTGLDGYEVDGVTPSGNLVFLSGRDTSHDHIVRVDMAAQTAIGNGTFMVDAVQAGGSHVQGYARHVMGFPSPDGSRIAVVWGLTTDDEGATIDAIGGVLLLDGDTLTPVRPAIRMSKPRSHLVAWAPDGEHFYIGASKAADPGDWADPNLPSAQQDGIAKFTREGVLVGTVNVGSWGFTPDAGFRSLVTAVGVGADGTVFVAAPPGFAQDSRLVAISDALEIRYSAAPFPYNGSGQRFDPMQVLAGPRIVVGSDRAAAQGNPLYAYGYADSTGFDGPVVSADAALDLNAADARSSYLTPVTTRPLQWFPPGDGRQPAPEMLFYMAQGGATKKLVGFGSIESAPSFEFDLAEWDVHRAYRLRHAGYRPTSRKGL